MGFEVHPSAPLLASNHAFIWSTPTGEAFRRNADPDPDRKPVFGFASGLLAAEGDRLERSTKLRGSHEAVRR